MQLPPLPYSYQDLEPFLSRESLMHHHLHHYRHHCDDLRAKISGTHFSANSLRDIVIKSEGGLFRDAAEVWNHNFYWRCLTPLKAQQPNRELLEAIDFYFDSFDKFKCSFKEAACVNLGSGWTWLLRAFNGELRIISTLNSDTPLVDTNTIPLLALDTWEHAYCLDYSDNRELYIDKFWSFVNWQFVNNKFNQVEHHLL